MTPNLTKRIENILRRSEDENEILLSLKQLLSEQDIQPKKVKESKTISELFEKNNELIMNPDTNKKFIQTGFYILDYILGGFILGDFVVIGGIRGMGKSILLVNFAINISKTIPTLFISLYLNEFGFTNRIISAMTNVSTKDILQFSFTDEERDSINLAKGKIDKLNLLVNDEQGNSLIDFRALCQKHIEEHDVKVIIVDELQLLNPAHKDLNSRELEISSISKTLKTIAKDFNVCVIAGIGLSDGNEGRSELEYKRPQLSDLRESGTIEQDADKIIFVHRPEYYNLTENLYGDSLKGRVELLIAKNRIGPLGEAYLKKNEKFTSFYDRDDYESIDEFNPFKKMMDEINEVPF